MIYGYARVSTSEQDLSVQLDALKSAGCDVVRSEKVSGTSVSGRNELRNLLDFARDGDTIVVTRVDRLARSVRDLQNIVHELKEKGVSLKATEQAVDTSTSAGKCITRNANVTRRRRCVKKAINTNVTPARLRQTNRFQIEKIKVILIPLITTLESHFETSIAVPHAWLNNKY